MKLLPCFIAAILCAEKRWISDLEAGCAKLQRPRYLSDQSMLEQRLCAASLGTAWQRYSLKKEKQAVNELLTKMLNIGGQPIETLFFYWKTRFEPGKSLSIPKSAEPLPAGAYYFPPTSEESA